MNELDRLRYLAGTEALTPGVFQHHDIGALRGIAAQIDRAIREGRYTREDVAIMECVTETAEMCFEVEEEAHLFRVYEDIVERFEFRGFD